MYLHSCKEYNFWYSVDLLEKAHYITFKNLLSRIHIPWYFGNRFHSFKKDVLSSLCCSFFGVNSYFYSSSLM